MWMLEIVRAILKINVILCGKEDLPDIISENGIMANGCISRDTFIRGLQYIVDVNSYVHVCILM